MAENLMRVRRHIFQPSGVVRQEDGIGNDAHHLAVQCLGLVQRFGSRSMLRQMIEPVFQLGDLCSQAMIIFHKFRIGFAILRH